MFREAFAVGAGGFVGAILRQLIAHQVQSRWSPSAFPGGTLTVNLIGCFAIGWLLSCVERGELSETWRQVLITGLLGSLTTFSTFSAETLKLLRDERPGLALLNALLSLGLGLLLVAAGRRMGAS